ncbi:tricarballylate dehydrogenase [Posidoniimonas corsicana]|uniref:Tricarballylate dehydrogenase n=1 Tax=Posidoniimonas corsicana TaxID=1938618 RepID=A0A5C5VBJ1_9BACT|nr:FAD-dependent oxidoreductase [Posidoniimonas corsicana]TWT35641.1 tricarballylate dehydrogenase [Posidoniimonas corsicana]
MRVAFHAVISASVASACWASAIVLAFCGSAPGETNSLDQFDVVVCGGSAAALAAAFTAAEEGARVALLEPTDWIGGQFTSSGVPAVDEAWHRVVDPHTKKVVVDVAGIARDPRNMTPFLRDTLAEIGNPGKGWVSRFCFLPRVILDEAFLPRERRLHDRLTVFRDTVVKSVTTDKANRRITGVTAIQRLPRPGVAANGYDRLLSEELADWYSVAPSERFDKHVYVFSAGADRQTVFIDATEWGEVLALSGASYLIGAEDPEKPLAGSSACGQAITFGFVMRYHSSAQEKHPVYPTAPNLGFGSYRDRADAWDKVWTYRRLLADSAAPSPGDLSLQNWGYHPSTDESGNDYPYGYLFLNKQQTARQTNDWRGGVDVEVLAAAERQAFAWHDWFRRAAPQDIDPDCFTIDDKALGTTHGLSKVPYIRDTRRSVGLEDFLLTFSDISGAQPAQTGRRFDDRVALGAYAADIHPLAGCEYSELAHSSTRSLLPYYIPYRSLTNRDFENLLVAGKTMAQTFLANSAVRLHPSEWSSGCAAGAAAAYLSERGLTSAEGLREINAIREIVSRHTPIDWTID